VLSVVMPRFDGEDGGGAALVLVLALALALDDLEAVLLRVWAFVARVSPPAAGEVSAARRCLSGSGCWADVSWLGSG
jgi:hypothetical protein